MSMQKKKKVWSSLSFLKKTDSDYIRIKWIVIRNFICLQGKEVPMAKEENPASPSISAPPHLV